MIFQSINSFFKFLQKGKHPERVLYYPSKISIETGNICNLCCPLCPTNDDEYKNIKKGFLSFADFKIIFDKIAVFVKTIDLFNWGEPFLNKDIAKIIAYARKKKPSLRMFIDSNLNSIDDDAIHSIVENGLNVLKVSCDGATQAVYEKYRIGGNIVNVLKNIERIKRKKEELGRALPRIIWKYLVFRHNLAEVEKARNMALGLGIDFEASGMRINCGKEIFEKVEHSLKRDEDWIPRSSEFDNYRDLSLGKKFCEKPWKTLTVNWDGEVVPCGAIYDLLRYSFGNLLKQDFNEIWNGEKFRSARRIMRGNGTDTEVICSECKRNGFQFF